MKALVVYESMFGHTEQIARAVAAGVSVHYDTEVGSVDSPTREGGATYDLILVGGPTHAFSMSRPNTRADALERGAAQGNRAVGVREWLYGLDPSSPSSQKPLVATFDTRVERVRRLPGSAAKAAAKRIRKLGYNSAAQPESFYVIDVDGPLADGELERAEAWGAAVARSALHHDAAAPTDS